MTLETILKNRPPYDAEMNAEVAKEYQHLQNEKCKVRSDHGIELKSICIRVSELKYSVNRLEVDMVASHERLEKMMQKIMYALKNALHAMTCKRKCHLQSW